MEDAAMKETRIPGGPLWLHWARTGVLLLLAAEYMRLVFTTDVAAYRVVVFGVLTALFGLSAVMLVRALRFKSASRET